MSRRQIHAYGLTGLLLLTGTLGIALAMLAHATMSGAAQWSAGALFGVFVAVSILGIIAIAIGVTVAEDWAEARRRRRLPVRTPDRAELIRQARQARREAALVEALIEDTSPWSGPDPQTAARDRAVIEAYAGSHGRHAGVPAFVPMSARPNPDPDPETLLDLEPAAAATRIEVWTAPVSDTAASAGLEDLYAHPRRQP